MNFYKTCIMKNKVNLHFGASNAVVDMQLKNLKTQKTVVFFARVSRVFVYSFRVRFVKVKTEKNFSKALFLADYKIVVDIPTKSTLSEKKSKILCILALFTRLNR